MNTIKKRWHKWWAIPLAIVLAVSIVVPWQLSRAPEPAFASDVAATNISLTGQVPGSHTFVQFPGRLIRIHLSNPMPGFSGDNSIEFACSPTLHLRQYLLYLSR